MIIRSENVTELYVSIVKNWETKFLPARPLPLQSLTKDKLIKEKQWGSQSIREELGGWTLCSHLKDKGMQTQYEVNNFSRVTFISKLNSSPLFHSLDMAHLYPLNGTKWMNQNVSSIWKVKDHGSCDVTWKPNTIFKFWSQNLMYTDYNGATCVYACCVAIRARICGKYCF